MCAGIFHLTTSLWAHRKARRHFHQKISTSKSQFSFPREDPSFLLVSWWQAFYEGASSLANHSVLSSTSLLTTFVPFVHLLGWVLTISYNLETNALGRLSAQFLPENKTLVFLGQSVPVHRLLAYPSFLALHSSDTCCLQVPLRRS